MRKLSPESEQRQEALEHLRTTYAYVLYYEPWTEANRRRLEATAKKFWAYRATGRATQKQPVREFVFKPRVAIRTQKRDPRMPVWNS